MDEDQESIGSPSSPDLDFLDSISFEHLEENAVCSSLAIPPGTSHPLQNPVILAHMFQVCPPQLLCNFRLVCKQWHDLSLGTWRSTVPIRFNLVPGTFEVTVGPKRMLLYQYLLKYVDRLKNQTGLKPFRHMKLQSWIYASEISGQLKHRFWEILGETVNTLELNGCAFHDMDEFRAIIFKYCPNLKNLRLVECLYINLRPTTPTVEKPVQLPYEEPAYGVHPHLRSLLVEVRWFTKSPHYPLPWLELLSHFQDLHSLDVRFFPGVDAENAEYSCESLLMAIKSVRQHDKRKIPLTSLRLRKYLNISATHEMLALLQDLQLPLESPELCLNFTPSSDPAVVSDILKLYAPELRGFQALVKSSSGHVLPMSWAFPTVGISFEKLLALQLWNVRCPSMEFLAWMPNLELLYICNGRTGDRSPTEIKIFSNTEELSHVKLWKMKYLYCNYIIKDEDLEKLISLTPKLESCEMVLNDRQFGIVCYNWRTLDYLKVIGEYLTDWGVVGLREDWTTEPGGEAARPNILYLENLRFFIFYTNNRLTDAIAVHGLFHLPKLTNVQARSNPKFSSEVSKDFAARNIRLYGMLTPDLRGKGGPDAFRVRRDRQ